MSASGTWPFGGIGTVPQAPVPPFFTLSKSLASAPLSPRYFAATSLYEGPTSFLSTAWQAKQPAFLASSSLARAGAAARAPATPKINATTFIESPGGLVWLSLLDQLPIPSLARRLRERKDLGVPQDIGQQQHQEHDQSNAECLDTAGRQRVEPRDELCRLGVRKSCHPRLRIGEANAASGELGAHVGAIQHGGDALAVC